MKAQTNKDFNKWLKSDNVIKTKEGYKTQCSQYRKVFSFEDVYLYFKREYQDNI